MPANNTIEYYLLYCNNTVFFYFLYYVQIIYFRYPVCVLKGDKTTFGRLPKIKKMSVMIDSMYRSSRPTNQWPHRKLFVSYLHVARDSDKTKQRRVSPDFFFSRRCKPERADPSWSLETLANRSRAIFFL